eukprot:COSAG01_NODE_8033_length_2948_cov_4.100386_3_plen_57_part_00
MAEPAAVAKAASLLSPVMEELEEPSERLELPPPRRLVKIMDRGWRSDDIKMRRPID